MDTQLNEMSSTSTTLEPAFLEFIKEKEKEIIESTDELKQVKDEELFLQRQKHQLEAIKGSLDFILRQKKEDLEWCRGGLTKMQQNIFDQIFPIVENIHHQELLTMELTSQLQLKQISRDVGSICSKITQESHLHDNTPGDMLWSWFREMKEYEATYQLHNNFSLENDVFPDCHFFHPSYIHMKATGKVQLTFSTRYKGFCLHLDISHERNLPGEEHSMPYKLFSDFAIDSLTLSANRSLFNKDRAQKFVEEIVWPSLGDIR
ncbi:uncharacterized protein [Apostichopus japonicus]|uniref:uncharacterized protein isoform X2 n=1 Tax=Stichopus japonicus TaxID=307972 RepID=UPI003AB6AFB2